MAKKLTLAGLWYGIIVAFLWMGELSESVAQPWRMDRRGVPEWQIDKSFESDVFTFVRIRYRSGWGRRDSWRIDYPESDLNFSYRLQELTSLKVDPEGKILELTDPDLFNYPFVYLIEPGGLRFSDEEVTALRKYLLGGGFMMVDDFWGEYEWRNFYRQFKRVFPEREPKELPLTPSHISLRLSA